jgi:hypothetical protein
MEQQKEHSVQQKYNTGQQTSPQKNPLPIGLQTNRKLQMNMKRPLHCSERTKLDKELSAKSRSLVASFSLATKRL